VLRRIFGPKRGEETGGWRKLHNEELHNVYLGFDFESYVCFYIKPTLKEVSDPVMTHRTLNSCVQVTTPQNLFPDGK
jgi:hypothetical protein